MYGSAADKIKCGRDRQWIKLNTEEPDWQESGGILWRKAGGRGIGKYNSHKA